MFEAERTEEHFDEPPQAGIPYYRITLRHYPEPQKLRVIRAIREHRKDIGLPELKALIEATPCTLIDELRWDDARALEHDLRRLGAKIDLDWGAEGLPPQSETVNR